MLQKSGHYFRVTKKLWRHSTWSANAKSCTYTGLSMSQMQKYPLVPAYHLLWTSSEDVGYIARLTQGTPAHNALHCQVGLASGRSLDRDWTGDVVLVVLRALDRPTPQRHWICSCQPLETGHPTGPWWSDATARAGYAMTTTTYFKVIPWLPAKFAKY